MQQQVEEGRRLVQLLARMCQNASADERRQGLGLVKAARPVLQRSRSRQSRSRAAAEVAVEVAVVAVVAVPLRVVAVPAVVPVAVPPHRSSGCLPVPSLVQVSLSSIGPRAGHPNAGHPHSIVMQ